MMKLDNFVDMMTGHFNNKEQFDKIVTDLMSCHSSAHMRCHRSA